MMNPPAYFEEVRKRAAQRWDQLENDPELARPWHQLFKQVQSPRHVVSELLQNADDAWSDHGKCLIEGNEFVFTHKGEDFQEEEFSSLCRFGYSNKRALHTIGFRGIGFKSTFSLGERSPAPDADIVRCVSEKRFTEPYWLNGQLPESRETTLRVTIQDELRKSEVEKNFRHWLHSPASMLFFRSPAISAGRTRRGGLAVVGSRASSDSEWMKLSSEGRIPMLLVRSGLEEFPEDAVDEIRAGADAHQS